MLQLNLNRVPRHPPIIESILFITTQNTYLPLFLRLNDQMKTGKMVTGKKMKLSTMYILTDMSKWPK